MSDLKRTLKGRECATSMSKEEYLDFFSVVPIRPNSFPTTANRDKSFIYGAEGRKAQREGREVAIIAVFWGGGG